MPPRNRKGVDATRRSGSSSHSEKKNSDVNDRGNPSSSENNGTQRARQKKNQDKRSKALNNKTVVLPQLSETNEDPSTICSVCANKAVDWAIGPCRHQVCGDCMHRMRVLYGRKTCVICSQPQRHLVVIPLSDWRDSFTYEDARTLPNLTLDSEVDMSFIDTARLAHFRAVRGFKCSHRACASRPVSEILFANGTQLRAHARSEHRTIYCDICINGGKSFVSELLQYSLDQGRNASSALRAHLRKAHPQCQFCKTFYLDDDKLYAHLQEAHETCGICERNGRMHEYYRNFIELERHYNKDHFTCSDESCRGVVFASAIELQAHQHLRHGGGATGGSGRSRALRVNLQQLHEGGHVRGDVDDAAAERQRQMARRRAFLSTQAVFAGALNLDDEATDVELPFMNSTASAPLSVSRGQITSHSDASVDSDVVTPANTQIESEPELPPRPPDDGKFHPTQLPRDAAHSQARNAALVRRMRSALDPATYEIFRQASARFQEGSIDGDAFYDTAIQTFGARTAVRDILPELVALLPAAFLREDLARTCLRRTGTAESQVAAVLESLVSGTFPSPSSQGNAGPSGNPPNGDRTGSARDGSSTSGGGNDQFPTLNGGPAPPVRAVRLRRFGAPGPEEFPRLGRVNGHTGNASSSTTNGSNSNGVTRAPTSGNENRTAANILRGSGSTMSSARIFGAREATTGSSDTTAANAPLIVNGGTSVETSGENAFPALPLRTTPPARRPNVSTGAVVQPQELPSQQSVGASLSETAFPALGSCTGPPAISESEPQGVVAHVETTSANEVHNLGMVWGGAPSQGQGAARRRGAGRGRGRRPATPPRLAFPSLEAERGDSSAGSASRGALVVDVMEREREKRQQIQKSSLPKVGGSGYGFAWERKKAQKQRKEIRNAMASARSDEDRSGGTSS